MTTDLTTGQKRLLKILVQHTFAGRLKETIVPIPLEEGNYAIYLKGESSFRFKWLSDFDALCDHGYLSFRWNRMSNGKVYSLTKAGFKAIEDGVIWVPEQEADDTQATSIKDLLRQMEALGASLLSGCEAIMPAEPLANISTLIKQTQQYLETKEPQVTQLTYNVHVIGTQLLATLSDSADLQRAKNVGGVLVVFGQWSQVAYQLLEELTKAPL